MRIKAGLAKIATCAALALFLVFFSTAVFAERWTFAAISDFYSSFGPFRNVLGEIRDMKANGNPRLPPIEFVLAVGDISPAAESLSIYRGFFPDRKPVFFPVRGNHEETEDLKVILDDMLKPLGTMVKSFDAGSVNYYFDWKNVRMIVLDQYSGFSKDFNEGVLLRWLEEAIRSAAEADHVFIAFHEPHTPREPLDDDALWELLLRNRNKVRAVFSGHTHVFNRRRIPDRPNGIYCINTGNAGQKTHSDGYQTIVEVSVDKEKVFLRAVRAPNDTRDFKVTDRWEITAPH